MKKAVAISFLLTGAVWAGETFDRGVVRLLNEANQQKLTTGSTALCLPLMGSSQDVKRKASERDMNDCVVALCGSPDENPSVYLTDKNFSKYLSGDIKNKINALEPQIKRLIAKEKSNSVKMLNEISGKVRTPHPETWSPDFKSDLSYRMLSKYMVEKVDLKKAPGERLSISLKDDQKLDPAFKKVLEDYKDRYQEFIKADVNSFLERGLYSADEQKEIAKNRLKNLKSAYAKISDKMNKYEREDVAKRIDNYLDELKTVEAENLSLAMVNLSNLEDQVSNYLTEKNLRPMKPSCENQDVCDPHFKKFIAESELLPTIESIKAKINDPEVLKRQLNQCKAKVVSKLSNISQQKAVEALVADVKKMMSKKVFSRFSAHSRGLLDNYFKNKIAVSGASLERQIAKTDNYETFKTIIEGNLKSDYEPLGFDEETSISTAISIMEEPDANDTLGFCTPTLSSNAFDAYLAYEKVKKLSEQEKKMLAKIPPKDNLFISPFSCHHDLRGKSVVAHELGHAVNQIFATEKLSESSKKQFKELRKCSTENYTDFIPDIVSRIHEGDAIRSEEDSADVFAYMAYPSKEDLFTCSLIKPSLDNLSYDELSIVNDDGDPHSTSLYRLIMEAINKNKDLPVSCQRALEPVKDQVRLKKCAL